MIYGHRDVWDFANGATYNSGFGLAYGRWQDALGSTGAQDMGRLATFLRALAWWRLVPSELGGLRRLVTSANGSQAGSPGDYVAAAADPAGSLALAFVPGTGAGAQSFAFDLRQMGGAVRARWWDPTTGAFTPVGTLANTEASHAFTTPGRNGGGANDWILVLDAASPRCGSIGSGGLYMAPATIPDGVTCQVTAVLQSDPTVSDSVQITLN